MRKKSVVRRTRSDPERGFVELPDAAKLAYEVHGRDHAGIPVLLIRPLGGPIALWGSFREHLSEHFRVISFDHRGIGRSSSEALWVSTKGLARDSMAALDHLGVMRAHVFGLSLGGMAASWLAIDAPTRVARLCIASAPARGADLSRAGILRALALAGCFLRRGEEVEGCLVDRIFSSRFRKHCPAEVRSVAQSLHANPASRVSLVKHALAGVLHDATRDLHRIAAPTLVLAGQDDSLVGTGPIRSLAQAIPHATFEIIAASGHDPTLEQPLATASRVARFFASS